MSQSYWTTVMTWPDLTWRSETLSSASSVGLSSTCCQIFKTTILGRLVASAGNLRHPAVFFSPYIKADWQHISFVFEIVHKRYNGGGELKRSGLLQIHLQNPEKENPSIWHQLPYGADTSRHMLEISACLLSAMCRASRWVFMFITWVWVAVIRAINDSCRRTEVFNMSPKAQ